MKKQLSAEEAKRYPSTTHDVKSCGSCGQTGHRAGGFPCFDCEGRGFVVQRKPAEATAS